MVWYALDHKTVSLLYTFLFPSFWHKLILVSLPQAYLSEQFIRGFLTKSNLAFMFLSVTSGLRFVVNSLYYHSLRYILIVGLGVVKVFILIMGISHLFYTLVVFQAFWYCWVGRVFFLSSFYEECLPNCCFSYTISFAISLRGLFWYSSLRMAPLTCTDISS